MSKGDKPRPMTVSYDKYVENWGKIFGEKHKPNKETLKSMEKTEKGEGLTEYKTIEEMINDLES
jgi:hypothetical protein